MLYQNSPLTFFSLLKPIQKPKIWLYLAYISVLNEYRRTMLGPFWILLSLIVFAVSTSTVYSGLFSIAYFDYMGYMTTGMIGWIWASAILTSSGSIYLTNMGFLVDHPTDKAYFIWAHAMSQVIVLLHQLPFLLVFYIFGGVPVNLNMLCIIPSIIIVFMIHIGLSGTLSVIVTRYRDLNKILSSLVIIIMITTPIFWKPEMVQGARQWIYLANPFYYIVEIIRDPLLGKNPGGLLYGVSFSLAVAVLTLGCYIHKRYSKYVIFHL